MPTYACPPVYDPVHDPFTGVCYDSPCDAESDGVPWLPGCGVASYVAYDGGGPWGLDWFGEWGRGGRRRHHGRPHGGGHGGPRGGGRPRILPPGGGGPGVPRERPGIPRLRHGNGKPAGPLHIGGGPRVGGGGPRPMQMNYGGGGPRMAAPRGAGAARAGGGFATRGMRGLGQTEQYDIPIVGTVGVTTLVGLWLFGLWLADRNRRGR